MADVFLSYKAEDRSRVKPLVELLEGTGLSVWWDARIGGGERWREVIQAELERARCVVVAWSHGAVGPHGQFVRDEAAWAQRRGTYCPVRLDDVGLPLGFGETQALSLIGWDGDRDDPRGQALLDGVHAVFDHRRSVWPLVVRDLGRVDRRHLLYAGGALSLTTAGIGGWAWWRARDRYNGTGRGIAVLPFADLTGNPARAEFASGLADELRSALTTLPNLRVIGGVSSAAVAALAATKAAAKLGVHYIVTGSVRGVASRLRISAELVDGATGVQQWSQSRDVEAANLLEEQANVGAAMAELISVRLGVGKPKRAAGDSKNREARDKLLKAMTLYVTADDKIATLRALALVDEALAIDRHFPKALLMRGNIEIYLAVAFSGSSAEMLAGVDRAERDVRRALAILPDWAAAHTNLGFVALTRLDLRAAMREYRLAQSLVPNEVQRWGDNLAQLLICCGEARQARPIIERLEAWDPLNPDVLRKFAFMYFALGDLDQAIAFERRALALAPDRFRFRIAIAGLLLMKGRTKEATAELARAPPDDAGRLQVEAVAAARSGDRTGAAAKLAKLIEVAGDTTYFARAAVLAQLGQVDAALAALETAWAKRDSGLLMLRIDPSLAGLRQQARFKAIETRMNYPA